VESVARGTSRTTGGIGRLPHRQTIIFDRFLEVGKQNGTLRILLGSPILFSRCDTLAKNRLVCFLLNNCL
jgi:hypothetical protein